MQTYDKLNRPKESLEKILTVLNIEDVSENIIQTNRRITLIFLYEQKNGYMRETCDRLSLKLKVTPRRVREVYFRPFVSEGILKIVGFENRDRKWEWIGYAGMKTLRVEGNVT